MKSFKKFLLFLACSVLGVGSALAEVVVIVNAKNPVPALTQEQVANVFLGKDSSFTPADLPESAAQRKEFYTKVSGKDLAQVKAIWSRLVFTGKVQPPKVVQSSAEAVKFVAENEKAIAYVDKAAVDASVKTVLVVN